MKHKSKYAVKLLPIACLCLGLLSYEVTAETSENSTVLTASSVLGSQISEMFNNLYDDNTWVFTGGNSVQGGFEQSRGIRNYVGQFEEYIRWQKSGTEFGRQRFVVNTSRKGLTLERITTEFTAYVGQYQPKAVAFMVGEEEYQQGLEGLADFKSNLASLISQSLALKGGQGVSVIQLPFATSDPQRNELIEGYIEAVREVSEQFSSEQQSRLVLVDHYTATNHVQFKDEMLTIDQQLNAQGHYEIGKQLSQATIKSVDGYPGNNVSLNLQEVASPKAYLREIPTTQYTAGDLLIELPEMAITDWQSTLKINGMTITDRFTGSRHVIEHLPGEATYELCIQSSDGKSQLIVISGKTVEGNQGSQKMPELTTEQEPIQQLLAENEPITWLFMGDSITHAAAWTNGYDGVSQLVEKALHRDYQRPQDVVINTAVSGATVSSTLAQIEQRLMKYDPDIVSIMLGTNDVANAGLTASAYKSQLQTLVDKVKEKGAQVILRSPTPSTHGNKATRIPEFVQGMKEVAQANPGSLFIDQYTELNEAFVTYPYLWEPQFQLITDGLPLHPGPNGQIILAKQFIKGIGLEENQSKLESLFYELPITSQEVSEAAAVTLTKKSVMVSKGALEAQVGEALGEVTLTAKTSEGDLAYSLAGTGEEINLPLLDETAHYQVFLKAYSKGQPVYYEWPLMDVQPELTTFSLTVSALAVQKKGEPLATNPKGLTQGDAIIWSVEKPEIASVDDLGTIIGLAPGSTRITAATNKTNESVSFVLRVTK